jgi:hypothetical protein
MTDDSNDLTERIARRGREVVVERLRAAFAHQAATRPAGLQSDPARLEHLVQEAADRSGGALWHRALAHAASDELGVSLGDALHHPAVDRARDLIGAPRWTPAATPPAPTLGPPAEQTDDASGTPQALRLGAVHLSGIETLRPGERDIELRLSDAGLDVLKRSTGAAIGRLGWSEIKTIELPAPRRGLRSRRRFRELHVRTERGQAEFELPGLTDEELNDHVQPMLDSLLSANRRPAPDRA